MRRIEMIYSYVIIDYDEIFNQIENILRGHGQDLALRDEKNKGVQAWAFPELLIFASCIAIWILQIIGKAIIEELVKKFTDRKSETIIKLEERIADLERFSNQLLIRTSNPDIQEITAYLKATAARFEDARRLHDLELKINISRAQDELTSYLTKEGLTERKSRFLASKLTIILPKKNNS